jgi:hypothetical protein
MAWLITCTDPNCGKETRAWNVPDLIENHRNPDGWFVCGDCEQRGYIARSSKVQEGGDPWRRCLQGAIPLSEPGSLYQPYAFLVSDEPDERPTMVQFAYYKDMRPQGGTLKAGHGPGGTPILTIPWIQGLVRRLEDLGCAGTQA